MNNQVSKGSGEPTTRTNDNGVKSNASNHRSAQNCADEPGTGSPLSEHCKLAACTSCKHSQIDLAAWRPFPQEFIHFTCQLYMMAEWFKKYADVMDDDFVDQRYRKLNDNLINAAYVISEFAEHEFMNTYFWNIDKSKEVETLKTAKP